MCKVGRSESEHGGKRLATLQRLEETGVIRCSQERLLIDGVFAGCVHNRIERERHASVVPATRRPFHSSHQAAFRTAPFSYRALCCRCSRRLVCANWLPLLRDGDFTVVLPFPCKPGCKKCLLSWRKQTPRSLVVTYLRLCFHFFCRHPLSFYTPCTDQPCHLWCHPNSTLSSKLKSRSP